jgi:hypothetical protein
MRTTMAILLMAMVAAADSRGEIDQKLDSKISLNLRNARLEDALEVFRSTTGLNFVAVEGADTMVSIVVKDVSARSALQLLLRPRDLSAVFENGAVVVRRGCIGAARVSLRVYDVRAMVVELTDFPGTELWTGRSLLCFCCCISSDEPKSILPPDFLVDLIKLHSGGPSWREDGRTSLTYREGLLYVNQTIRVHREIEALLARLQF